MSDKTNPALTSGRPIISDMNDFFSDEEIAALSGFECDLDVLSDDDDYQEVMGRLFG